MEPVAKTTVKSMHKPRLSRLTRAYLYLSMGVYVVLLIGQFSPFLTIGNDYNSQLISQWQYIAYRVWYALQIVLGLLYFAVDFAQKRVYFYLILLLTLVSVNLTYLAGNDVSGNSLIPQYLGGIDSGGMVFIYWLIKWRNKGADYQLL